MGLLAPATLVGVLVVKLLIGPWTATKLVRRGIDPKEVGQLPGNGARAARNPRPRRAGSRFLIGPTNGGRMLTVVVEPEPADDGIWHVQTAWDSSAAERMFYYRRS